MIFQFNVANTLNYIFENNKLRIDDYNIHQIVKLWISNKEETIKLYGYISNWNTSEVTNMSFLLKILMMILVSGMLVM